MAKKSPNIMKRVNYSRSGIALAESALVLPALCFIIFAMLDLTLMTLRHNALTHAALRIAREVALHGSQTLDEARIWGPSEFDGTAADSSPIVASGQNFYTTMVPEDVRINVSWLNDDNSPRDPLRVRLTYTHKPLIEPFLPWGEIELEAVSNGHIVN